MVFAVAGSGYAATTIGDVVRTAQVSRHTFYEHFADKEACFLAAFENRADRLLAAVDRAIANQHDWQGKLLAGFGAYLDSLADEPDTTRVFVVDSVGAGPRILAGRRAVYDRRAVALRELVAQARAEDPAIAKITRDLTTRLALAVIGARHELIMAAVERDRADAIGELKWVAADLLRSVVFSDLPVTVSSPRLADEVRPRAIGGQND